MEVTHLTVSVIEYVCCKHRGCMVKNNNNILAFGVDFLVIHTTSPELSPRAKTPVSLDTTGGVILEPSIAQDLAFT